MAASTSDAKTDSSIASILKMAHLFTKLSGLDPWRAAYQRPVDGRIYIGTEQGDLYCLNMSDGSTVWKARIGADSDSTPAVANGRVYTAAEDGYVYCFDQSTGELLWKFKADGGLSRNFKERSGFWASPIVVNDRDLHWLEQRFHVLPDRG